MALLAVDVGYGLRGGDGASQAIAAGVIFDDWPAASATARYTSRVLSVEDYSPGAFYKRELPCILQLLSDHQLQPDGIVIDGYVYLDGASKPGLGKYLFDALGGGVAVIGVAKTAFAGATTDMEIFRGSSTRPLFVTSAGLPLDQAKLCVRSMHGAHRIPTLLNLADRLSRSAC